ncbi:MAG: hypothetical protein ACTSX7_11925 [Alphaproteobacteria bacterium]
MITPEMIVDLLGSMVVASRTEDGVRVSTHVLYPSNGAVSVVVRGGKNEFMVSDDGGAVAELVSSGIVTIMSDPMIKRQIKQQGLRVYDGSIISPMVPLNAVPAAILLVANASRHIADWGLSHLHFRTPLRNFREDLAELLSRSFHDSHRTDTPIVGKSNKAHKFGHVIYLHQDRQLLIDPVVNDASSINARVVANLDVRMAENPLIQQLIVYDDHVNWKSSDLKLLQVGAPTVGFSHAEQTIKGIAA